MAAEKSRVLVVTRNFPPLVGGMERLLKHAVWQLERSYLCDVVGPINCQDALSEGNRGFGCPASPVSVFLLCAAWRSLFNSTQRRYKLCLAGSAVTAPIAVVLGRLLNIPSLVFLHGLDLIAAHRAYQRLFIPFVRRADMVIVNSRNTAELARDKGVRDERIEVIFPGVEIPRPRARSTGSLQNFNLEGRRVLLAVGRIIPRKGLAEFVDRCLPTIVRAHPDTILLVVGEEPTQALSKPTGYLRKLENIIARHHLNEHVLVAGRVDEETLERVYQLSELLVFPVREVPGDVEGFGMVAVEAAAHGLPTVAFAAGGVPDAVADGVSGRLIASDEYEAFTEAVRAILDGEGCSPLHCISFAKSFTWARYGDRLLTLCANISRT